MYISPIDTKGIFLTQYNKFFYSSLCCVKDFTVKDLKLSIRGEAKVQNIHEDSCCGNCIPCSTNLISFWHQSQVLFFIIRESNNLSKNYNLRYLVLTTAVKRKIKKYSIPECNIFTLPYFNKNVLKDVLYLYFLIDNLKVQSIINKNNCVQR